MVGGLLCSCAHDDKLVDAVQLRHLATLSDPVTRPVIGHE